MKTILIKFTSTIAFSFLLFAAFSPAAHAWRRFNPVNNPIEARRDINNNGVVGPRDRAVIRSTRWAMLSVPRVNTPVESRFDHNNNGWVGPRERYAIRHRNVSNLRDFICDRNHNGIVGPGEAGCAY